MLRWTARLKLKDLHMQFRPTKETLFPLAYAAKFFPRRADGKKIHRATIYRYTVRGKSGVVLESAETGASGRCVSREGISRFFAELTRRKGLNRSTTALSGSAAAAAAGERLRARIFSPSRWR